MFLDPGTSGVTVRIGANGTSAESIILGSNRVELVKNPDFYSSADQWFAQPGSYIDVYWAVDYTGGSSGGTAYFSGSFPSLQYVRDSAFVFQQVTTPSSPILTATMTVRYRLARLYSLFGIAYYVFGVWDPSGNGSWAWLTYGRLTVSDRYITATFTVTNVSSGRDYWVVGGVSVYMYAGYLGGRIDYFIDYIQLSLVTADYTFSNTVLDLNVTLGGPYYARLLLVGIDAQPDLDCNITLTNWTGYRSSPIIIRDGVPQTLSTSEIILARPTNVLYVSGYVDVSMVKSTDANSTVVLELMYCTLPNGGGACVTYPLTLVLDPRGSRSFYNAEYDRIDAGSEALAASALRIDLDGAEAIHRWVTG